MKDVSSFPPELLLRVFQELDVQSQLAAGLVCRKWLKVLFPLYQHLTDLTIVFQDNYCEAAYSFTGQGSNHVLSLTICQCNDEHIKTHKALLGKFLSDVGAFVKSLIVEDFLLW